MRGESARTEAYGPEEDTLFLEDHLRGKAGRAALDIGTGAGYITRALSRSFSLVVGTDIDYTALRTMRYGVPNVICCDGAGALGCAFDLIVCNLPYLATDHITDAATDGGKDGIEVGLHIIESALPHLKDGGELILVSSSLAKYDDLINATRSAGLHTHIAARKKLFFEELVIIKAVRPA